jgi:subtilisin family serine protease
MAAPVVSGLAALLMAYYPNFTAAEVKHVILASASSHATEMVVSPGGKGAVPFGSLSVTGGIVNAFAAVKMAQELGATRP